MSNPYVNIFKFIKFTNIKVNNFEGTKKYISTGDSEDIDNGQEVTYENRPSRANIIGSEGDILIAKMANTNKVLLLDNDSKNNIYSTGFYCINSNKIFVKYLYYLLSNEQFNREKDSWSFGTTQIALNENGFKRIKVQMVSSIDSQIKVSMYLDKKVLLLDKQILNQQQQIEKLKEYKQSLISETVTKGLDPNVEFKDSGIEWIGKIPKYWNLSRIKDLLSIPLFYGSNKTGDLFNEDYPRYIRITDIQEDSLTTDISNMQSYLHSDYKKYLLQENDVLFARSGATSGKTYLVKHEDINNVFAGYLINGRFDQDKINPYFFNYYTKSSIWDMWKNYIFIQATIQNISAEKFNSFILSVPTLEDQNRIVDFLNTKMNKLDELIRLKKNKVAKLENFKKSLIYEYVTGKKEVS